MSSAPAIEHAASAILTLINSRPYSPSMAELEAIIGEVAKSSPVNFPMGDAVHRTAWDAAVMAAKAAGDAAVMATGGTWEATKEADEVADDAESRLDECAQRIIDAPVRGWADVELLAMVCFRMLWTDKNLTDPDADAELANGPYNDLAGICLDALAALLRGIRNLSALPRPPTEHGDLPLAPCGRLAQLRESIAAVESTKASLEGGLPKTEADEVALSEADRRLDDLAEDVWESPVRTLADLQERALIANHFGARWRRHDGVDSPWQHPNEIDDFGERTIGHLIHAVLQYDAKLPPDLWQRPALQEASAAVRAWHGAYKEEGISDASDAARDAQINAAHDNLKAAAHRIWDMPPTSWADVVARALIVETISDHVQCGEGDGFEDGALVYLDPAEVARLGLATHCDLVAMAHLLDAIRKVSGANGPLLGAAVKAGICGAVEGCHTQEGSAHEPDIIPTWLGLGIGSETVRIASDASAPPTLQYHRALTHGLDLHRLAVEPDNLLTIDCRDDVGCHVKDGEVVLVAVWCARGERFLGHIVRQFVAPDLLITNSSKANRIVTYSGNKVECPYELLIAGKVIGVTKMLPRR